MCSSARMGLPAATRPTSGSESCARLGKGRLNCLPRASLSAAQCVRLQADAARGAAHQFDHAFARQRLQVVFGRIGRFETEFGGDFSACGRRTGAFDGALNQIQNLLLAVGQFGGFDHVQPRCLASTIAAIRLKFYPVPVFSSSAQKNAKPIFESGDPGHRRHDRRHRCPRGRQRRLHRRPAGRGAARRCRSGAGRPAAGDRTGRADRQQGHVLRDLARARYSGCSTTWRAATWLAW